MYDGKEQRALAVAALKACGELGVKEGEVCLFLGGTVKMLFSGPQYKQNVPFRLVEWLSCTWANKSICWSGSFIICWEIQCNQVRWPISMVHLVEYENSSAIWGSYFSLPLFYYIYYSNGKPGCSVPGDAVTRIPAPNGGWGPFKVPVNQSW